MGIGRKRRRGGGELGRVAEIVMVMAAAGEARGGRAPTAAERALAAEARGALAAVVAGEVELLRPRELFTTEAVRALVQDLGLTRTRDPAAVGFRPRKASIAERVLLTKRKMEEVKEALVPSPTVPKMTASSARKGFQHGASKITTGVPRNLSTPMTSPVISKQPMLNATIAGASSIKSPDIPSAVSLPPIGSADVEMEIVVNGSNFTQNGGAETIEQSNKSGHHTANSSNRSSLQSSSQAEKSVDEKEPAICPGTGSVVMGYQAPKEELSVQKQTIFSNHKAIAKNVARILRQPANHPSWSVPSTEYMNKRLDCQICKVPIINMESLLVCDACERGAHVKCLQYYGNQGLQKPEWYCPTCVLHSKGKPLPPKYGKVSRTVVVPNTCMINGAQPSQVAAENPTEKDGRSDKNVAANGSVINQNTNKVGSTVCKSGTLALDATGSKSPSGAEPRKEDVKHDETSSVEKEGNGVPSGGIHTETATLCNKAQSSGASTYSSGNLSGGSHMYIESSSVSPVNYSILQSTALFGVKHADHSSIVSSVENCQSTRAPTDELYQADGVTNNGIRKPHKHETMANDAISDHDNAHQMTLNGHLCSKPEIIGGRNAYEGSSTASIIDWVGDGLKSIDNKTYYNSCNIDGVIYNLHDHMLIASEGGKFGPCKLQSLWEEHDSGSRLAMVNPYIFGSDIPGSISKPCIDEEDEVYGSNNDRIVLVSAIHGPCEVLHVDKFREETKRRCQVDSSGCVLHPIFFCRWNYDDSTSSFYKDYNVDN
ncbi:hypothetical protein SEVIR_4G178700v4 [Setaria viridis]|uniref:PHD-type domain-containing protein n=2 Tax=Setaria viridis TaxID=4556 RepID=A0A4U6UX26_SETVI|nr:uncharacterized protein LOC117852030 isoform X1 [Setaria viridis]TKW21168.1 hypothetical protein SEVIR_4G178700v2 [Setaria viridis]